MIGTDQERKLLGLWQRAVTEYVEKARVKLRGELPPDVMFSCAADRRFLKRHDLHPAEFLRKVLETENDRDKLVE